MNPVARLALFAATVSGAAACVTINIYFPAAAAEKAADRIIEEVWQLRQGATPPAESKPNGETK
jgi:hypothetical protein